ncbi:hypothetical protein HOF92_12025 [bacterium]|jgi:uncharacterized phage infection (PIP) family protein YhgE|nr:hypothetical protein [bacterium]
MDEAFFREISSQIAKDVEAKVKDSMGSMGPGCADGSTESKGDSSCSGMMGPQMGQEMFDQISKEVSSKISQSIAGAVTSQMGAFNPSTQTQAEEKKPEVKKENEEGQEKIFDEFSMALDRLISSLEGSVCTVLDLSEDGTLGADAVKKKLSQVRNQFRADLDELMKKRDWKIDFLKS